MLRLCMFILRSVVELYFIFYNYKLLILYSNLTIINCLFKMKNKN